MKNHKVKRRKLRALEGYKKIGKNPKTDKITFQDLEKLVKHLTLKYCLYLEEELKSMDYLAQELLEDKKSSKGNNQRPNPKYQKAIRNYRRSKQYSKKIVSKN